MGVVYMNAGKTMDFTLSFSDDFVVDDAAREWLANAQIKLKEVLPDIEKARQDMITFGVSTVPCSR